MWENLFDYWILERGYDYYLYNRVQNVNYYENYIEATVSGSMDYMVIIELEENVIKHLECDCPYADKGKNCKHMAAVLYYLEENNESIEDADEQEVKESIEDLVNEASELEIREFLTELLTRDGSLVTNFKQFLQLDMTDVEIQKYKNEIKSIFYKHQDECGFIDYRSATYFGRELVEFIHEHIYYLIDNQQYKEAFELSKLIFIEINHVEIDDSDGEIIEIAGECLDIWSSILKNADTDYKTELFNWFIGILTEPNSIILEDYIEILIFDEFKDKEFQIQKMECIDKIIKKCEEVNDPRTNHYYLGTWLVRRLDLMIEMNRDDKEIIDFCKSYLHEHKVRSFYIDYSIANKDYETAIELLEAGKRLDETFPGRALVYSRELKELYKLTKNDKKYKEELEYLILNDHNHLSSYEELKSLYTKSEWTEKREILFSKLPKGFRVDRLYALEGLYDLLLEIGLQSDNEYVLFEHEEILKGNYPEELLNKYEEIVEKMALHTGGRSHYRNIVNHLNKMLKYPDGKTRVQDLILRWMKEYKKRPAMIDELSKVRI